MEIMQSEIVQIRSESVVSYKMIQNMQNDLGRMKLEQMKPATQSLD